jgi:hypothetical protein
MAKTVARRGRRLQEVGNKQKTRVGPMGRMRGGQNINFVSRSMVTGLDKAGLAHARLLLDPCNGPLTYPCYEGGCGGILTRTETDLIIGATSGVTSGLFHWTPGYNKGYTNAGSTYAENLCGFQQNSDTIATTVSSYLYGQAPLPPFAVGSSRCVAACMQVWWPGTELNRQGFVTFGNTSGNTIFNGMVVTVAQVKQSLTNTDRVPDDFIEQVWIPTEGDEQFIDGGLDIAQVAEDGVQNVAELAKHGSITLAYYGLPSGTGLRVRMVAVYESTIGNDVTIGQGVVQNLTRPPPSTNRLADVLRWLYNHGPGFAHKYGGAFLNAMDNFNMSRNVNSARLTYGELR